MSNLLELGKVRSVLFTFNIFGTIAEYRLQESTAARLDSSLGLLTLGLRSELG